MVNKSSTYVHKLVQWYYIIMAMVASFPLGNMIILNKTYARSIHYAPSPNLHNYIFINHQSFTQLT